MKLEKAIFSGAPEIHSIIDDIKKMDVHHHLAGILPQIETLFKEISPRLLNQLAVSHIYKKHINEYLRFPSKDTTNQVKLLINQVERDFNHRILHTNRHDIKTKRVREKGKIMTFYKSNHDNLRMVFDLHNLFLKVQDILSNA